MEWSARHPTQPISAFEDNNRGCIFIYKLDSDDQIRLGQRGNIAYLTDDLIYLLRIEADNKSHYIYIKSKDHFFNLHKHTHDTSKRFCPICSNTILIDELRSHISKCYNVDTNSTLIKLPPPANAHMQFKSNKNKLKRPYVIYADTECSSVQTGLPDKTHTHVPNSACFYLVCDHDPSQNRLEYYIGENGIVDILIEMTKIKDKCIEQMKKNQNMKMSAEDMMDFKNATHCSICEEPIGRSENDAVTMMP